MALAAGTMLGPYRIKRLLGAGGMGEVYEATDTRLDRAVAIKVLPDHFASDSDRRERFNREARAVSSLNHPNIATLYDVGEQNGSLFLVMELVHGRTLDAVLHRGKLPLAQALTYASQIARALDAAHRANVVHRDLKPGNVMITSSGPKLLDFGLAKLTDEPAPGPKVVTEQHNPITSEGTVLGTAQYMAPEQLEGRSVDARADIFSFGSILYELLTGRRAFQADSAAGLAAAILTADPPPLAAALGDHVPPALEQLVRMCLAKNPEDRWQTAHDVGKQLDWIAGTVSTPVAAAPVAKTGGRTKAWAAAAAALVIVTAVGFGIAALRDEPATPPAPLMRFTVSFEDDVVYAVGEDFIRSASISPDGSRVVFTGIDRDAPTARLFVRAIDSVQATPIEGSEGGTEPFWSPDSRSVGFFAAGKVKIASLAGGAPRDLANAAVGGGSWNDDGQVLINLQNPGPIVLIPAAGGTPRPLTTLEPDELDHGWPQFLDDGEHFMYMARGRAEPGNKVYLRALSSPRRSLVLEGVFAFAYAAPDRVLYLRGGTLLAQTLDIERGELVGSPVQLAASAQPPFSASRTGALTYRTVPRRPNPLLWIGTDGREIAEAAPPGHYADPQISPDGTQVALATRDDPGSAYDISILDVATQALRKLTLNPAHDRSPVWSPDGNTIVFVSTRPEAPGLYRKNANGIGAEELILPARDVVWPYQWKGDRLFFFDGPTGANDVGMLSGAELSERTMLVTTPFNDVDGALAPDGEWFVYTSNETGRWEMFLTTISPSATKLLVMSDASDPVWSVDGRTLYFTRPSTAALMALPVTAGSPPTFGAPRRVHAGPYDYPSGHNIDVHPSGDRLIAAPSLAVQGDLTVLVNWQSAMAL